MEPTASSSAAASDPNTAVNGAPYKPTALQPLHAHTANNTPISSPGLFSPVNPRATMSLPSSQPVSETTTPAVQNSPYLHPLQTHKVRE